jgi:hypothetical protein
MPRGDKSSYSGKQKRKAEHVEEGYKKKGVSRKEAERRAWATVNKQDGGAQSGSKAKRGAAKKSSGTKKSSGGTAKKRSSAKKASGGRKSSSRKR